MKEQDMPRRDLVDIRGGTVSEWTAAGSVLAENEVAVVWEDDGSRHTVVVGDGVRTAAALYATASGTYVAADGGSTITGEFYWRGAADGSPITAKPTGDGRAGVFDLVHNDTTGYVFHITAGAASSSGSLIALGLDNSNTRGLLIANKASGKGIVIDQRSTVTAADGYGIHATQQSGSAPLVRLEQQSAAGADVLQLLGFSGKAGRLLYVGDSNGAAGQIQADDAVLEWFRNVEIIDPSGGTSWLDVRDNNGIAEGLRDHTLVRKDAVEFYSSSGSDGLWWPFGWVTNGSHLYLRTGGATGTVGSTPATTLIDIQHNKLGFFGTAAQSKQTVSGSRGGNAALASLITALATMGLLTDSSTA